MSTRTARSSKLQNERHAAILRELLKQPSNRKCADCKRNDPRWASWNLGIFICIRCSGVHRSMGTHISKVKSVDLDTWTPEQIENMKKWGNYKANLYWEANLTERDKFQENNFERWIRSKYEFKRFVKSNDLPDPDTLPNENGESKVSTSSTKQTTKPLVRTEEVQGIFSTSNSSKKSSNNNGASSSSNNIFLFQDFSGPDTSSSSTNNNRKKGNTIDAFINASSTTATKVSNQQNKNDFKNTILSLYNTTSSPTVKPANSINAFAQFGNASTMNPTTGMPLAFQASLMQPQSSNGFGSTLQPTVGFNNIMPPQSSNGFSSSRQPSSGFGNSMNNSGFSSTMQQSKPAAPKHDPFDFISLSSFSNNTTKSAVTNSNNNNNNNNTNDDFSDFQTVSTRNSNWANF